MLIAEEIVQKLSIPGNYEVFEDAVSLIPETELEQIPENILSEVKNLGKGSLRIESGAEAFEELTEETEETTSKAETKESSAAANTGKSGKRSDVSNIFLKTGICLVIISLCLKIYSNKRKDKK